MKIIYILFAGLCLLSCEKTKIEDVIREVEPDNLHPYIITTHTKPEK